MSGEGIVFKKNAPVRPWESDSTPWIIRYTRCVFPILFQIGSLRIATLGVFLVIAFLVAGFAYWWRGKSEHYEEDELFDGFLIGFGWLALGSRIGFILMHMDRFGLNPLKWADIVNYPGLSLAVGILLFPIGLLRHARQQKWDTFQVLDMSAIASAAGLVVYAVGAFFDGTLVGNPTKLPIGLSFPGLFGLRHPAQLYLAAGYLLITFILLWAEGKYRLFEWYKHHRQSAQSGFVFALWLLLHAALQIGVSMVAPAQFTLREWPLDLPLYAAVAALSVVVFLVRSGRVGGIRRKGSGA